MLLNSAFDAGTWYLHAHSVLTSG